jgi:hypothetical protein
MTNPAHISNLGLCFGLAYRSQREERSLRKLQRAKAIRAKLGGASDVTLPFPAKPQADALADLDGERHASLAHTVTE